jgi:hypothetical protein
MPLFAAGGTSHSHASRQKRQKTERNKNQEQLIYATLHSARLRVYEV